MIQDYEKSLDENFDKALKLCSNSYSYQDLITFLKNGNIPEKQFAALEICELKNENDAQIFLSNLINCDGKIREAVAQKFSEFVLNENYRDYFCNYPDILAQSTIDINANISRMVIDGLSLMSDNKTFGELYVKKLTEYIYEAFDGLDKIVFRDKKYTINKQLFKLYWCLEGINNFSKYLDKNELYNILERTLKENEYTVREKAAQILIQQTDKIFQPLQNILKDDNNYYIKRIMEQN